MGGSSSKNKISDGWYSSNNIEIAEGFNKLVETLKIYQGTSAYIHIQDYGVVTLSHDQGNTYKISITNTSPLNDLFKSNSNFKTQDGSYYKGKLFANNYSINDINKLTLDDFVKKKIRITFTNRSPTRPGYPTSDADTVFVGSKENSFGKTRKKTHKPKNNLNKMIQQNGRVLNYLSRGK